MKHGSSIFIGSCVGILTAEDSEDVKISEYIACDAEVNVVSIALLNAVSSAASNVESKYESYTVS